MNKVVFKKKLLTVLCLLLLLSPAFAEEPAVTENNTIQQAETVVNNTTPVQQETAAYQEDKTTKNKIVYKEPVSKRKIAMKFIYAMLGVAISSILLFVLLTIYNKIRSGVVQPPSADYTNTLATPNNLKDAVNIYLEKTK